MYLYIQYMTSIRCKMAAKAVLESLDIGFTSMELGKVQLHESSVINEEGRNELQKLLKKAGLNLLDDQKAKLVEHTKLLIVEMVHYSDSMPSNNIEVYIADKLQYDYQELSDLFALVTGVSIMQHIAFHKIECVKELLLYEVLNLKEISKKLQYSSVEKLTAQFKQYTGLTPSFFVAMRTKRKQLTSKA